MDFMKKVRRKKYHPCDGYHVSKQKNDCKVFQKNWNPCEDSYSLSNGLWKKIKQVKIISDCELHKIIL